MIKLIVAKDINGLIGKKNKLPWRMKAEMDHFISTTWNSTLLMGRKTYESLPKKILKSREVVVLTRQEIKGVKTIKKTEIYSFFNKYRGSIADNLYICGGKTLYEEFYTYASELIISTILSSYSGDTYLNISLDGYRLMKEIDHKKFIVQHYEKGYEN